MPALQLAALNASAIISCHDMLVCTRRVALLRAGCPMSRRTCGSHSHSGLCAPLLLFNAGHIQLCIPPPPCFITLCRRVAWSRAGCRMLRRTCGSHSRPRQRRRSVTTAKPGGQPGRWHSPRSLLSWQQTSTGARCGGDRLRGQGGVYGVARCAGAAAACLELRLILLANTPPTIFFCLPTHHHDF